MKVDLSKQLKLPAQITPSWLIIVSNSNKQLIILELTVPWEEHMVEVNKRKHTTFKLLGITGTVCRDSHQISY